HDHCSLKHALAAHPPGLPAPDLVCPDPARSETALCDRFARLTRSSQPRGLHRRNSETRASRSPRFGDQTASAYSSAQRACPTHPARFRESCPLPLLMLQQTPTPVDWTTRRRWPRSAFVRALVTVSETI